MVLLCDCKACPLIPEPWPDIRDGRETEGKADLRLRFTDLQLVRNASCPGQAAVWKPVKATRIRIPQVRIQTPILCGSRKAHDFEPSLLSGATTSLSESD